MDRIRTRGDYGSEDFNPFKDESEYSSSKQEEYQYDDLSDGYIDAEENIEDYGNLDSDILNNFDDDDYDEDVSDNYDEVDEYGNPELERFGDYRDISSDKETHIFSDENEYFEADDGGDFDDINTFQDEVLEEKNPDELKAFLASNGEGDIEDDSLLEQVEYNRYVLDGSDIAEDVSLIDDPDENHDKPSRFSEETIRYANMFMWFLGFLILLVTAIIMISLIVSKNSEKDIASDNYISPSNNNPIGNGELYSPEEESSSNEEASSAAPTTSDNMEAPEGGSLVRYEITTQGDISGVALSYIDATGGAESNSGVSLPWSTTVPMERGYTPIIKANSEGTGTITCTITSDGNVISRDTNSGDNPSVSCDTSTPEGENES